MNVRLCTLAAVAAFASLASLSALGSRPQERIQELPSFGAPVRQMPPSFGTATLAEHVPGEVLVKFRGSRAPMLPTDDFKLTEQVRTKAMEAAGDPGFWIVEVDGDVATAIQQLKQRPDVLVAEPNYILRHHNVANDTQYVNGSLWGVYGDLSTPANQFGSQAAEAWARGNIGNANIHVAVIDEGVLVNHDDLRANMWVNPYDAPDGIDNDGNGFVDDVNGWDFNGGNNSVYDGSGDDHGTHVAGTIGAKGGNLTGVAGVVWNVRMISVKFLGSSGGTTANAIRCFDYVTDLKTRHSIDIVASNNSWGGGGFSQLLKDAIDRHGTANILAVCSAGNSNVNTDVTPSYPGSYTSSNIICVASITSSGARSSFSNFGATSVDIGAPGSSIVSTIPTRRNLSGYASYSGTSMASPHVSGAVALLANTTTSRGLALRTMLLGTGGTPTTSMNGVTVTGQRLNAGGF